MNKKVVKKDERLAIDMLHYKPNRLSFWLIILTIALNIAMFLIIYKTTTCTPGIALGIDLLINVTFMLACFLAAERTKQYSREWGITSIVLGGVQIARLFCIPLYYFLTTNTSTHERCLGVAGFTWCVILFVLSGISLIVAGMYTLEKHKVLKANKPLLEIEGAKKDVRT